MRRPAARGPPLAPELRVAPGRVLCQFATASGSARRPVSGILAVSTSSSGSRALHVAPPGFPWGASYAATVADLGDSKEPGRRRPGGSAGPGAPH